MSNFKDLPDNDENKKLPTEIRSLIWKRTRSNLGVVEMLLNVMDLFFVKAGATLGQSLGTPETEDNLSEEKDNSKPE